MKKAFFIQSNTKQYLGAQLAKYALESRGGAQAAGIPVTIMLVENIPVYLKYAGMQYKRGKETRVHDPSDLQFFTLSRFMPPELMQYDGRAIVIDPDIFALKNVTGLFDIDLGPTAVAACRERTWFDSSVMLLDNARLTHWSIEKILAGLKDGAQDYDRWMRLMDEPVHEIPRFWNSIDLLTSETKMLHTSRRLTQPWKTGLPIDFIPGTVPKLFGIIPRFWVTHPHTYQPHPDPTIERVFFELLRDALQAGAITDADLERAMKSNDVRHDAREVLAQI